MTRHIAGLVRSLTWAATIAVGVAPSPASGQTVRGLVTDRGSGVRAAGAVVILEGTAADSTTHSRSVLADASGVYQVLAWGPGLYRLSIRRIGRMPFLSEPLELGAGQVRTIDVEMDPIPVHGLRVAILSTVNVKYATPCHASDGNGSRIATLWDDARTALMATEISERDRLVSRRLVRFIREIDVPSMNVMSERLNAFDANDVNQPQFRSLSGDSLSLLGYWRVRKGSIIEFHGLDASALLSEAFVRDHCFSLVEGAEHRPGHIGLDFEPVPVRARRNAPPEVRGTIWLDEKTSALQAVEFKWTKLDGDIRHTGGEVQFARVEAGPWFVSAWRLRMPREVVMRGWRGTTRAPGIVEEGGLVLEDSVDNTRIRARIEGEVRDGNQRAMAGVVVRVLGTEIRAVTGADGRYILAGVPPGLQFVVAEHPSLKELGIRVGQKSVLLDDGGRRVVSFSAPSQRDVVSSLCGDGVNVRNHGIVRVTLIDSATASPVRGARLHLTLKDATKRPVFETTEETDGSGAVVFCGVPAGQPLVVTQPRTGRALLELTMSRGTILGRAIRTGKSN
jgi:Carboxypeptidase regulatory-like domain